MTVRPTFMKKYFPRSADPEEQQNPAVESGMMREFCSRDGYKVLREDLTKLKEQNKPRPDGHEGMLYQVGIRDGIELVEKRLDSYEQSVGSK